MRLNLYDTQLNRIAVIGDQFISCMWSEGYNTVQPFTLELRATAEYKKKVKPDCYVGRDDRKTMMVIKTVQIKQGRIVASGKQAARCLDDVACEAILPAGSLVDAALAEAWKSSDGFDGFVFEAPHLDTVYDHQISNKTFMQLLETMCQDTDTGFRVVRSEGQLEVQFYKPEQNPNCILSELYGNLKVEAVTLSTENLKNHAIVLGEGEGEDRFRVHVDLSGGGQKRSMFVDARSIRREEGESDEDYSARLYAHGAEKMLTQKGTEECAFKSLPQEFGRDYDLGDIIAALLPEHDLRLQARISRFTQTTQNNITDTVVEVGKITILR